MVVWSAPLWSMTTAVPRSGCGWRVEAIHELDEHFLREDVDHLPIAVVGTGELAPHTLHRSTGSTQSLKGAPLRKAPGLRASTGT
jgi:hypothetical protein